MRAMGRHGSGWAEDRRAAIAAIRLPPLAAAGPAVLAALGQSLAEESERRRLFPWIAVAFGAGILACFEMTDGLPNLAAPLVVAALLAASLFGLRARPVATAVVIGLAAAFLGFAAATYRIQSVAGPILARTTIAPLTGVIESIEEREEGARLVLLVESFGTLAASERPTRIRASYRKAPPLTAGDRITATARLLPPPEAALPGGYDFARDAYFRGIGAVGSLTGRIAVLPPAAPLPGNLRLAAGIDTARNALTRRITESIGGQAGAVAAALVTGKRGLIDARTSDVLRAAGIYHVISISGLHMVLAAGVVFFLVRASLAAIPVLALGWPIKKIAAACAMAGVTAYCAFSGWDVAAERSLVMTLVMLGAILVDRPALSMRNLALAALIALAREPEALLGPSFQMSFGAVAGLIACAPLLDRVFPRAREGGRWLRLAASAATATLGTLATTLVAQIATAPFATYHFQTVQPFGLVGNALTLPLVSLVVMPSAVLGMLATPFALDRPVWWLMGLAVKGMLAIATWIAGFDAATLVLPAFGTGALAALTLALLLLVLPGARLRWLALLPVGAGLCLAAGRERPDILIDRHGAGAAVRGSDGRLVALGKPSAFVLEQWLKADGDGRRAEALADRAGARCDPLGCTLAAQGGLVVAYVSDKRAFREDCARADIVISGRSAPPTCAARLVVDRGTLERLGAVAIDLKGGAPALTGTREQGRSAPWRPPPREAAVPAASPAAKPEAEDGAEEAPPAPEERLQ
ncbi:ComEC/Rec2 family competence protein [Methylobacterium organophilum]|uniref:Competence protein ComEC n=1 Tax=Methylobacterium organophilum TaxID=410 RepID=A0ABQ4T576_METOR|nr:ComEC/Rec2 family competence protein [Methylobacterium organophilum]GJE26473.1 hypothetical protein LKMONMHP_1324 [Methylobacterium organophilum]